jgi:hypothetical protein
VERAASARLELGELTAGAEELDLAPSADGDRLTKRGGAKVEIPERVRVDTAREENEDDRAEERDGAPRGLAADEEDDPADGDGP